MKKVNLLCALAFLTITVTNTVDYCDAKSATKDLFTVVRNDPYNWRAVEKAIQEGAYVNIISDCGYTILHELLYSANRSRQTLSTHWIKGERRIRTNHFDHEAFFPIKTLEILLNAGANPTMSHSHYNKILKRYEHKKSFLMN